MKSERCAVSILLLMLAVSASGCVRIDIGDHLTAPTLGKQLVDLDTALQSGALNLIEYTRARETLLGR